MARRNILRRDRRRAAGRRRFRPAALELEARTLLSFVLAPGNDFGDVATVSASQGRDRSDDPRNWAGLARGLARRVLGKSINHPIDIGTVAAGQNQTVSGSVTPRNPQTFYELQAGSQEVIRAALSVRKGDARFTMMDRNHQAIASLRLSGTGTDAWTLGPGTSYLEVSRAGKGPARYQISVSGNAPSAPPTSQPGNPSGGNPGNPSGGNAGNPAHSDTVTSLVATPLSLVYGQTATFTATVRAAAAGSGIPKGTVTFLDGSITLGTETLDSGGIATWSTSSLSAGTHAITAIYSGDGNFNTSASAVLSQVVNPASSATHVAVNLNPAVYGQVLTFTVSVTAAAQGSRIPTGTVLLNAVAQDGSDTTGTEPVDGQGTARFSLLLGAGSYAITASYGGDSTFQPSASQTTTTTVDQAGTQVVLTSSASPLAWNDSARFTATLTVQAPGAGNPTGRVQFQIDGANFGTPVSVVNDTAVSPSITSLILGRHTITATYSGDSNFQGTSIPSGQGLARDVEMTEQQFEAALESQIQQGVKQFAVDATTVEAVLPTIKWNDIDPALIVVDSDVINGNYMQAFQDIQAVGNLLFAEALDTALKGLPWWDALLGYSQIVQDLQDLGALKEISYGFLADVALAIQSTARSSPAYWTTGVLGTGSTGGFLSPSNQGIFTTYSSGDLNYVNNHLAYLDAQEGVLASNDLWYQEAQQFDPFENITTDRYGDPTLGSDYSSIDGGDYSGS